MASFAAHDRATTAIFLAHIAEVDARRLFAPAGYSSMFAYCVEELHLSEDATAKRIQAARAARRFPALFTALAEGRLHLTAVWLLAPHLTAENVGELIGSATHRKKSEVEEIVAGRFSPQASMPRVRLLTPIASARLEHAPEHVRSPTTLDVFDQHAPARIEDSDSPSDGPAREHAPGHVEGPQRAATEAPAGLDHAPERFLLQLLIDRDTRDKLQRAVALLSHSVPDGSVAQVLKRALDALIAQVEKRKLGSRAVGP
ncbi:MAG TPA: hypothetical protein VEU09_09895, partial [Candidatus Binatia bacterium]|nr:hypothetical protein [Candidatus Binatia bacterium]